MCWIPEAGAAGPRAGLEVAVAAIAVVVPSENLSLKNRPHCHNRQNRICFIELLTVPQYRGWAVGLFWQLASKTMC